jgi:hypothetical protein
VAEEVEEDKVEEERGYEYGGDGECAHYVCVLGFVVERKCERRRSSYTFKGRG